MRILLSLLFVANIINAQSNYPRVEITPNNDTVIIMSLAQMVTLDEYSNNLNSELNNCLNRIKIRDTLFLSTYDSLNIQLANKDVIIDSLTLEYQATINDLILVNEINKKYLSEKNAISHTLDIYEDKMAELEDNNFKVNRNSAFITVWGIIVTTLLIFNFSVN